MSLGPKDLVIYNKNGNVMAGGFKVDTIYGNESPLKTLNSIKMFEGKQKIVCAKKQPRNL